jgi:hypothetical protein
MNRTSGNLGDMPWTSLCRGDNVGLKARLLSLFGKKDLALGQVWTSRMEAERRYGRKTTRTIFPLVNIPRARLQVFVPYSCFPLYSPDSFLS